MPDAHKIVSHFLNAGFEGFNVNILNRAGDHDTEASRWGKDGKFYCFKKVEDGEIISVRCGNFADSSMLTTWIIQREPRRKAFSSDMSHKEMLEAMITGKELKGSREYARHRYIVGTDKRPAKIPKEDQRDYRLYKE